MMVTLDFEFDLAGRVGFVDRPRADCRLPKHACAERIAARKSRKQTANWAGRAGISVHRWSSLDGGS